MIMINWDNLLANAPNADTLTVENAVWNLIHELGQRGLKSAQMWFATNHQLVDWDSFEIADITDSAYANVVYGMMVATPDEHLIKLGRYLEHLWWDNYTPAEKAERLKDVPHIDRVKWAVGKLGHATAPRIEEMTGMSPNEIRNVIHEYWGTFTLSRDGRTVSLSAGVNAPDIFRDKE